MSWSTCPGLGTCAPPTFAPAAGTYSSTQTVTITSPIGTAGICYTTDGSTPAATTAGTCSTGTSLASGGTISVSATETVKAIATKVGFTNSSVASAAYTITGSAPAFSSIQTIDQDSGSTIGSGNWVSPSVTLVAGKSYVVCIYSTRLGGQYDLTLSDSLNGSYTSASGAHGFTNGSSIAANDVAYCFYKMNVSTGGSATYTVNLSDSAWGVNMFIVEISNATTFGVRLTARTVKMLQTQTHSTAAMSLPTLPQCSSDSCSMIFKTAPRRQPMERGRIVLTKRLLSNRPRTAQKFGQSTAHQGQPRISTAVAE